MDEKAKACDEELTGKKDAEAQAKALAETMQNQPKRPRQIVEVDYQEGLVMAGD